MASVCVKVNHEVLLSELFVLLDTLATTWTTIEDARDSIYNIIQQTYNNFLICQATELQKDEEFKTFLFESIEDIVMTYLNEQIFSLICGQFQEDDDMIYRKCKELCMLKVTADQLGAMEDLAIPLPAAIVELASLDIHSTPTDKFTCLSDTFDLVLAELKGAIVDIIAHTTDNGIPILNVTDITPILSTVIIHAQPLHLLSNMYYIENFCWSKNKSSNSESILAFKTAIDKIKVITPDMLHPRSSRIYCDISIEDVLKITDLDKSDARNNEGFYPKNPLEKHIQNFTTKIAAAALSNLGH